MCDIEEAYPVNYGYLVTGRSRARIRSGADPFTGLPILFRHGPSESHEDQTLRVNGSFFMKELVVYETEYGRWEATYDKLPGFRAQGRTREEALDRLKDAIRLYDPCRCEND